MCDGAARCGRVVPGNGVVSDDSTGEVLDGGSIGCACTNADAVEGSAGSKVIHATVGFIVDVVATDHVAIHIQHLDAVRFNRLTAEIGQSVVRNGVALVFDGIELSRQFRTVPVDRHIAVGNPVVADADVIIGSVC